MGELELRKREAFLMWQLAATRVIALAESSLERGGLEQQMREAINDERHAYREWCSVRDQMLAQLEAAR